MLYTRAFHPLERLVVKHLLVQHSVYYVMELSTHLWKSDAASLYSLRSAFGWVFYPLVLVLPSRIT